MCPGALSWNNGLEPPPPGGEPEKDSQSFYSRPSLSGKEAPWSVDWITAWTIVAELGTDMSAFRDADHAASWAGLVHGNLKSAGKRKSNRTRHGNCWLRRALCQ